jgi:hypothetical protein
VDGFVLVLVLFRLQLLVLQHEELKPPTTPSTHLLEQEYEENLFPLGRVPDIF